ncbi:MAG: choline dehydrogenase [Rhizobiales bacterium]|nr:choline dehydrogenase [Hyphomicrobiales bacterium]
MGVLLLEAGPADRSIYIRMPAALGVPLSNKTFNWYYHSEPDPFVGERAIYEARGRVLGGSSSINGLNWVRGNPWDYDNWSTRKGLENWSYARCLPYFRKAETFKGGASTYRGGSGPMRVEVCPAEGELFDAFLESGVQAGYPLNEDHNAFRQDGVHKTQRNVHHGVRWNTAEAYLRQPGHRSNLTIRTGVHVTGIEMSGKRAVKVRGVSKAEPVSFEVGRELIVAGGALNSPQLLMLSGLGDADALRALDIPVVAHLPGVGRNLMDHPCTMVQHSIEGGASMASRLGPVGRLKIAAQWMLFKSGLGSSNYFETGAFLRTRESVKVPNLQYEFIPLMGEFHYGSFNLSAGFQYFFALMRPTSRGRVWIGSADPMAAPKFVFNYLSTEEDRQDAIAGVRITRDVVSQSAWNRNRGQEVSPGPDVRTDEEILAHLKQVIGTQYHPCGTCRMGTDDMSVVDGSGRVHGMDNLRVIDASIMPEIVSGNLNAPVIMIAEKLADELRGRTPLPPEQAPYYKA